MRRISARVRPTLFVFEDLSPVDFIQSGDYVFIDIMTEEDAFSYCRAFPNAIAIERGDVFKFLFRNNVSFRSL